MSERKNSGAGYIARLGIVLFLITAITAGLLGAVNALTKDKIAEIAVSRTQTAMAEVLPGADSFVELPLTGEEPGIVTGISEGITSDQETVGYVVQCEPSGFGGVISMVVGVDPSGVVTGVKITSLSETAGLGSKAKSEPWFLEQFTGKSGQLAVGTDIDALTGATVTSKAVTNGVNAAIAAVTGVDGTTSATMESETTGEEGLL